MNERTYVSFIPITSSHTIRPLWPPQSPCAVALQGDVVTMATDFAGEAVAIAISQLLVQHGFASADPAAVDLLCEVSVAAGSPQHTPPHTTSLTQPFPRRLSL